MDLYRLLLGVLCAWRITHLIQAEDGPWDVVARMRRAAGDGWLGRLLDCFYCLSLWVAAPLGWVIGRTAIERVLLWLAFSGGAILAERSTSRSIAEPPPTTPAEYKEGWEDK
ncbi:MAG TPA: DUF1360 domain-containing protein [Bryobacteraceae bacterium]|nr:DUF1360 domain-containing protein [Bryobacteraceae bacterium]